MIPGTGGVVCPAGKNTCYRDTRNDSGGDGEAPVVVMKKLPAGQGAYRSLRGSVRVAYM